MLSTSLKTQWQRLLAIACCGAISISAAGVSPANAERHNETETGISLYGETPQANQPGQGYIIFEQQGDRLVGAFYYPQSEYSCFTGTKNGSNLEILALPNHQDPMANLSLSLNQMQQVQNIGVSEKQTLAACRQDVVAFLNQRQSTLDLANQLTN